MICNQLEWDTFFFGKKIFKIESEDLIAKSDILHLNENKLGDLYYFFCKTRQPYLEECGAFLVDEKITFKKKIEHYLSAIDGCVDSYEGELTSEILELGLLSGSYSRFKSDQMLGHRFVDLYTLWMRRSITREIADEFLVYNDPINGIVGFATIKTCKDNCSIGLISVHPDMRGKGIGSRLIAVVNGWGHKRGLKDIYVVTQRQNVQACLFYEKVGFIVDHKKYIYHYYTK